MANTKTKYLGLDLKNPIIVGSSGLTDQVSSIKGLEKAGAGAVVLKSLFAAEILLENDSTLSRMNTSGTQIRIRPASRISQYSLGGAMPGSIPLTQSTPASP